jgi:endonuclease/exonuclease/phosphatase family metal-dependent hydrolase
MATRLRIATFNLENLDTPSSRNEPTVERRAELMRPQLVRLEADVLCLQEIHSQDESGERTLSALDELLQGTPYADYHRVATSLESDGRLYSERNLVILSRFEILNHSQYKHDYAPPPAYRLVTADPPQAESREISWERPILHARSLFPTAEPSTS